MSDANPSAIVYPICPVCHSTFDAEEPLVLMMEVEDKMLLIHHACQDHFNAVRH